MTASVDPTEAEEGAVPTAAPLYDYDDDFQTKITALALRDPVFAQRTDGLIKPEYFANTAEAAIVRITQDYYEKYKKAPDKTVIGKLVRDAILDKRIRKDMAVEVKDKLLELYKTDISDGEFVIKEVADFARSQALTQAIMKSVDLLDKRDFAAINDLIRKASDVGAGETEGVYDFWAEIENRTTIRKEVAAGTYVHDGITTGNPDFDKYLYHRGWGRGELSVLMGAAKAGKSMSLGEFAKFANLKGYNVLYVTLEVHAKIIADRLDANLADTLMKDLTNTPFDVERKVKALHSGTGVLKIIERLSSAFRPSNLRRLLEQERAAGIIYDLVVVDYADLMTPERSTGEPREDSKSIYTDLRMIANASKCALLTATQTNREGAKAAVAKMTDVAEDFNKIRIADIVISINATTEEVTAGEARLFFAASRNSKSGFTVRIKQERGKMKFLTKILGEE